MALSKIVSLGWLNKGDSFEIVSLENSFKNLIVKRTSDCSVSIEGDKFDGETWAAIRNYAVSCGTPVRKVNKK